MITKFNNLLFKADDKVCAGSLFDNTISNFIDLKGSTYFTINALANVDYGYKSSDKYDYSTPRRADINVKSFRNFMFEMDNESLESQLNILNNCGIPWTSVVFSGSKSYHAILSLENPLGGCHTTEGIESYKNVWKRLERKIEAYANGLELYNVVDPSSKNPSRFSRYPETVRDNGEIQKIIKLGNRITSEDFATLLASCPKVFVSVLRSVNKLDIQSLDQFWANAPRALADELRYPMNISPQGQYPRILRISLWMKDLGIPIEVAEMALSYKLFPKLIEVGYIENRLCLGLNHAYKV